MQRFRNILCVIGDDFKDKVALHRAVNLAGTNNASLTVINVYDEELSGVRLLDRTLFPDAKKEHISTLEQKLNELVSNVSESFEVQTKVLDGISFIEIIKEVLRYDYDLVIKSADNDGFLEQVFGSNDMHLTRKCPCPVWLDDSNHIDEYTKIAAAVDAGDLYPDEELAIRRDINLQIIEMATSLAINERAELHIIVAYMGDVMERYRDNLHTILDEALEAMKEDERKSLNIQIHMTEGIARRAISSKVNEVGVDLLVMGTVARTSIPGFIMGNTAETIQNEIKSSLLAIKPETFETPVMLEDD
jgi:universal stress protein E